MFNVYFFPVPESFPTGLGKFNSGNLKGFKNISLQMCMQWDRPLFNNPLCLPYTAVSF